MERVPSTGWREPSAGSPVAGSGPPSRRSAADLVVALLRATVREMPAAEHGRRRRLGPGEAPLRRLALARLPARSARGSSCSATTHDAEAVLEEGVAEASVHTPSIQALCLAHLAVLHVERDDWPRATSLARQAREVLVEGGLGAVPNLFLVTAVSSLVEAHAGRLAEADRDRLLTAAIGWSASSAWLPGRTCRPGSPSPAPAWSWAIASPPAACSTTPTASSTGCPMPSA